MLAILNSLNAHNFPICQPILMIHVSKLMVHRALSWGGNSPGFSVRKIFQFNPELGKMFRNHKE